MKAVADLLRVDVIAPGGLRVTDAWVDGGDVRLPLLGESGEVAFGPFTVGRRPDGIVVISAVGSDVDVQPMLELR